MLSLARILLAGLFAAFVLGGCSVRMAYSQLDWLVPWYLRDYVMLDAGQRNLLDRQLSARLDWHCRTHLAEYAATLREAQTTLAADRIGSSDLLPYLERGEGWWREILAALEDDARVLLPALSDEQVDELQQAFERRQREARKAFLGGDDSAQREARIARMEKRLQRWFGRLTTEQRVLIGVWSDALEPTTEAWLDERARWQADVLDALRVRADGAAFAPRVAAFMAPVQDEPTPGYRARQAHNRDRSLVLLAEVFNTATPAQRQRLQRELEGLAAQFERLACAAPQAAAG
ncbi:DUF6279 family lipoprotein [Thauera mechernichensis]|uniref:DUF6279 family lipoprotein n=1 Tax=Thauera mechernichensis TaxID=82788 RepID=A0ABW3WB77_9RHOO|nr:MULTISPECIES: DUF6279 family lipoprotein [Thauera]ENO81838.1 hypothetical protein B447_06727 [Thauera sp. 27]MDG3064406.1 DUF6279 family lipoprotein [Thauera mechernichensis]